MAAGLDDDTARTLASGRQTIGSLLSAAQTNLKRVFLLFVVVMMLTIWALRAFIWDRLKADLVYNRMDAETADATEIVVVTPFDVILMQVKIGLVMGVIAVIPLMIWYSRDSLKERGIWPDARIPLWKKAGFVLTIAFLFSGGIAYAYFFFFPIMFDFLAANAVSVGFSPTWSIVMWTEFIFFLALSFGLAAQLPLAMSASARTGIVRYETFRDKWRYAVVGIFVFGAMFSPPDPFTQVMWGVPLVALYFISLGVTKLAVLSKEATDRVSTRKVAGEHWNTIAGATLVTVAAVWLYLLEGGVEATNDVLESTGSSYRVAEGSDLGVLGLSPGIVAGAVGVLIGLVVVAELLFYFRVRELSRQSSDQSAQAERSAEQREAAAKSTQPVEAAEPGERAEIDIGSMSAQAIEATPPKAFLDISEQQVLQYAEAALEADDHRKGQAILDKYDAAQEIDESELEDEGGDSTAEGEENIVTSTAAGILDPFTEDETTEDDIGGYYYDIAFIVESLTSKAIWVVGTFMVVMAGTFMWLYTGGIGDVTNLFFQNMPSELVEEPEIVVLHPVEALIFMLKFSTLVGFISIVPIVLYLAWPAIEERGFSTGGDRSILLYWGGTLFLVLGGGTALGFLYIAPTVISLLAWDVVNANMVIAYRISSFGWLIVYLTFGVGILTMIPTTMVMFHHGNIVSYSRMRERWRVVILAFFALAGLFSPSGIFTMFIVAIPASIAYLIGLGLLWIYTRIGTTARTLRGEAAD